MVSYIDGDVPLPPYPAWSMTDEAIVDLGRLTRRLHEATASMDQRSSRRVGPTTGAIPLGGPVICHNDLFPENVVFRDGRVVALIDFDMAAPGRALLGPRDRRPGVGAAPRARRTYRSSESARRHRPVRPVRPRLWRHARTGNRTRRHRVRRTSTCDRPRPGRDRRRKPAWIEHWRDAGGDERAHLDETWLEQERAALFAAIVG